MRTARILAATLLGVASLAATALAQERERPRERPREGRPEARRAGDPTRQMYQRALQGLDLKAEQRTQINQKLQTHQQARTNWQREHGAELTSLNAELRAAREKGDRNALRELSAKRAKLMKEPQDLQEKLNLEILALLEGEQKERFVRQALQRIRPMPQVARVRLVLAVLNLKKAQTESAGKTLARVSETPRGQAPAEGRVPLQTALQEIRTKILTPDQAKKFDELLRVGRARDFLAGVELTAEQEKAADEIMAAAMKKAADADRDERRTIYREAMQKIRDEVLTEEQRQQLQRRRQERGRAAREGARERPRERPAAEGD